MIAMSICYPLDRVRTLSQVGKVKVSVFNLLLHIIKTEGWSGLYQGLGPVLVALGSSNFVYFYWYTAFKTIAQTAFKLKGELNGASNLLLASIAGSLNVVMTAPLWVVVTRLAIQSKSASKNQTGKKYKGMIDALQRIYREEGVGALWAGTVPSLILVSNPSVQFASYERLKQTLLRFRLSTSGLDASAISRIIEENGDPLSSLDYMVIGALAKMIATVITYPLQVAQTKIRADKSGVDANGKKKPPKYKGTFDCLMQTFDSGGIRGLYRGMDAKILQTCSTSAFMFVFYEKINAWIFHLLIRGKISDRLQAQR